MDYVLMNKQLLIDYLFYIEELYKRGIIHFIRQV